VTQLDLLQEAEDDGGGSRLIREEMDEVDIVHDAEGTTVFMRRMRKALR
jgi:hypothetical protein